MAFAVRLKRVTHGRINEALSFHKNIYSPEKQVVVLYKHNLVKATKKKKKKNDRNQ